MGKVLEKLSALPTVKFIEQTDGGIKIVMRDDRETLVQTAHAARLFIQGDKPITKRKSSSMGAGDNDNGDDSADGFVEEAVVRYKGILSEDRKPIWELPTGYCANTAEGIDAFKRGFAVNSHPYGECAAAKDFEAAWHRAAKEAEQTK